MVIDPIPADVSVAPIESVLGAQPASPSHVALYQAKAEEQETLQQRADHGDPIAVDQLAREEAQLTPIRSQGLQPVHLPHGAGATEPGKGGLIDVYD